MEEEEKINRFRELIENLTEEETVFRGFLFYYSRVMSGTSDDACVYLDYNSLGGIRSLILSVGNEPSPEFRRGLDSALEKFGIRDNEFNGTSIEDKRRTVSTFEIIMRAWNAYMAA